MKSMDSNLKDMTNHIKGLWKRQEDAERYSRRWNLRLINLPEKPNETAEMVRKEVFDIVGHITPEDTNKLGFLIDTVHEWDGREKTKAQDWWSSTSQCATSNRKSGDHHVTLTSWRRGNYALLKISHTWRERAERSSGHRLRRLAKQGKKPPGKAQMPLLMEW